MRVPYLSPDTCLFTSSLLSDAPPFQTITFHQAGHSFVHSLSRNFGYIHSPGSHCHRLSGCDMVCPPCRWYLQQRGDESRKPLVNLAFRTSPKGHAKTVTTLLPSGHMYCIFCEPTRILGEGTFGFCDLVSVKECHRIDPAFCRISLIFSA